jgi:hypothetical protein
MLFINNELYELNKPGFCRDSEGREGKYQVCIREIIPHMVISPTLSLDSVFVFERHLYHPSQDSTSTWTYVGGRDNLLVKKEVRNRDGKMVHAEVLYSLQRK